MLNMLFNSMCMIQSSVREDWYPARINLVQFEKLYSTNPDHPGYQAGNFVRPPYRRLREVYTPNSTGNRYKWRAFQHYKCWSTMPSRLTFYHGFPYLGNFNYPYAGYNDEPTLLYKWSPINPTTGHGYVWFPNQGLPDFESYDSDGNFVLPPADLSTLKDRSMKAMLPVIKSELSLVNSLIELRDFASLPRTVGKVLELRSVFAKARNSRWALRKLVRAMADSYLQAQFNIMPLLSDIAGIRTALSRYERKLNSLISRQGRPQSKHFVWTWVEHTDIPETQSGAGYILDTDQFDEYPVQAALRSWRSVIYRPTIFHAQLQYNYNFTGYQLAHARVLALLDALGVNLNPAIIWNAIPWSFVVDWVLGVSRWLNQYANSNMAPVINIHRYLWSVKRERIITTTVRQYSLPWSPLVGVISGMPMPVVTETAYRRDVEVPTSSSIQSSGLSLKEFSLGAALILSRGRRRKSFRS